MKKLQVVVLALLLCGGWQVANGTNALRSAMRGEVVTKKVAWQQHVLAAFLSLGLFGGTAALTADAHEVPHAEQQAQRQHLYQAEQQASMQHGSLSMSGSQPPAGSMQGWQERLGAEDEEDNALAWSEEVTLGSGVFYLFLHNAEYDHIHHVVYVGVTLTGEPLFAGVFLDGHEEDYIRLYGHDGLVTKGFFQRDIRTFPDPLDLYAEVTVFTIKDLNLQGRYEPVNPIASELLPVNDVGAKLKMLQYGVREDDPESHADLPLQQRNCEVLEPNVWGKLGIMRHSCTPLEGAHSRFGAPIFNAQDDFVGFFSETAPSGANLAEGMTQAFFDFLIEQQANPTAVNVKGKLPVVWGELKLAH